MTARVDVAIVGAGILGLATARALLRERPGTSLALLEKEDGVARHQSGRNSGVLHAGIYYAPGSHKARLCRAGRAELLGFCAAEGIPVDACGKLVVATDEGEVPRLEALEARARANGVLVRRVDAAARRELEPHAGGVAALHVPETAVLDFGLVCARLAARLAEAGAQILLGHRVSALRRVQGGTLVESSAGALEARLVVGCAGLHSDRVARLDGGRPPVSIVPFRGEYHELVPARRHLCRGLIYPVPDPRLPFLGPHLTRRGDGRVECGPNAVLALAREGYRRRDVRVADMLETLGQRAFWRLGARHWRSGAGELWRSLSRRAFARALRRLVPELAAADLVPSRSGVRAQALGADGTLVDDFLFEEHAGGLHVLHAPSPAASASLAIGAEVARALVRRLPPRASME